MSDRLINVDSREGFEADELARAEFEAYLAAQEANDDACPLFGGPDDEEDDYPQYEDDGQPDEYTEWQDLHGGDDWDFGQFDSDW